jgi:hypothetical protein
MTRLALALLVAAALVGCSRTERAADEVVHGDCMAELVWDGATYSGADLARPLPVERPLPPGVVPACSPDPEREVAVAAIRGIHPEVAVSTPGPAETYPGSDLVWLGAGYLATSPFHPLHDEIRSGGWEPQTLDADEWTCGPERVLRVRARERPGPLDGFVQIAADPETAAFVRGDDIDSLITLETTTRVVGLRRHGVPYIGTGTQLLVTVQECVGKEDVPGAAGLRLVVATEVRAGGG